MTDLDYRLKNWGRGVRVYSPAGLRILSMEGGYRSPQRNHWEAPVSGRLGPIDVPDAWVIEAAVCCLPMFHHSLLAGRYVYELTPGKCVRMAARAAGHPWRGREFEDAMANAKALLAAELELPAVRRMDRARDFVRKLFHLTVLRREYLIA